MYLLIHLHLLQQLHIKQHKQLPRLQNQNTNQESPCGHSQGKIYHIRQVPEPEMLQHQFSGYPCCQLYRKCQQVTTFKVNLMHRHLTQSTFPRTTFVESNLPPNPTSKIATSTCIDNYTKGDVSDSSSLIVTKSMNRKIHA